MEWFVEVRIAFAQEAKPTDAGYADKMDLLYDALSEYLSGMEFEPAVLGLEGGLETYLYLNADDPEGAAEGALRMFSEASERVWGPGTRAEVARVMTAEERDRELDAEEAGSV